MLHCRRMADSFLPLFTRGRLQHIYVYVCDTVSALRDKNGSINDLFESHTTETLLSTFCVYFQKKRLKVVFPC